MSLLTPERVPVKVYRWDDAGAPALDKTAGCMATIFKACLDTGYGAKEGAGWTMPFEDTASGVKVLRPEFGPHTDFYLRLSADTGTEMAAQVYINMTDVNTGDLKLQCNTPFKYAATNNSGKWILIASPRGFWFFCEQALTASQSTMSGAYFFVGDLGSNSVGLRDVYLKHTGGTSNYFSGAFGYYTDSAGVDKAPNKYLEGKLLAASDSSVATVDMMSLADGGTKSTDSDFVSPAVVVHQKDLGVVTGLLVPLSGAAHNNFDIISAANTDMVSDYIVFGSSSRNSDNLYIAKDNWSY